MLLTTLSLQTTMMPEVFYEQSAPKDALIIF